jgi:putative transposase
MPRAPRPLAPDATYHLMARGNNGRPIYSDDHDRGRFLRIFSTVVAHHQWVHLGYCLMGNHFHLLVRTPKPDLPSGMRQLLSNYSRAFNRRHGQTGHLFRERYKAVVVKDDRHLFAELRYVMMNPVRAGLVQHPYEWRWSSYPALLAGTEAAVPIATDEILGLFHPNRARAQALLRAFVEADYGTRGPAGPAPDQRLPSIGTLVQLLRQDRAIAFARELGYSQIEIADYLGLSRYAVARRERRCTRAAR